MSKKSYTAEKLKIKSFYGTYLEELRNAQRFARENGFTVASMPQLTDLRVNASNNNEIWSNWFTTLSEEDFGIDIDGRYTNEGQYVIITTHGDGILTSPERLESAYKDGLTIHHLAKLTSKEIRDLLHGGLPNGKKIRIFSYDEFLEESALKEFSSG